MHAKNTTPRAFLLGALLLVGTLVTVAGNALADDPSVNENVTALKDGIVSTLATWIPFVILFVLIGLALSALGINLFRHR